MARRSTARAAAGSAGGPKTPGPASCIAPNPTRLTVCGPSRPVSTLLRKEVIRPSCRHRLGGAVETVFLAPRGAIFVGDRPVDLGDPVRVERRPGGDLPEDGQAGAVDVVVQQLAGEHRRQRTQCDLPE